MFIPNLRKGVSVVGLLVAIGIPWLIAHGPDLLFHKQTDIIAVPAGMRACTVHEDCGYVETACSACCRYEGINKTFNTRFYRDEYSPACETYQGAVCDCVAENIKPVCIKGICRLTRPSPVYND